MISPQEFVKTAENPSGTFMGMVRHNLDPKKRLTIPTNWRDEVPERKLFCLPGFGRPCLMLLPQPIVAQMLAKMQETPLSDPRRMMNMLAMTAHSDELAFDVQGRIRVRDEQLERAGLTGEVIIAGVGKHLELWSPAHWAEVFPDTPDLLESAQSFSV